MGQICCCYSASDCVSVVSLQDCTLQQSSTDTVKIHPGSADGENRSFKSFLRRAGNIFKKTSSSQGKEEKQDTDDVTVVATASAHDQTHHITSISDPEDDEYWLDEGFQDLVGEWSPAAQAPVSSSASAQKPFTGHSEDDEYWLDSGFQDLVCDLSEWCDVNLWAFPLSINPL